MLAEELAPLVVEHGAVGLDGVLDVLARPAVTLDELDRTSEEIEAHQRRLAALPGDGHVGVRCDSSSCRMYGSSRSSAMRNWLPG